MPGNRTHGLAARPPELADREAIRPEDAWDKPQPKRLRLRDRTGRHRHQGSRGRSKCQPRPQAPPQQQREKAPKPPVIRAPKKPGQVTSQYPKGKGEWNKGFKWNNQRP